MFETICYVIFAIEVEVLIYQLYNIYEDSHITPGCTEVCDV